MTFTTSLKEEIAKNEFNIIEARWELVAFLSSIAKIKESSILITLENASVARRIYKEIKEIYRVSPKIIIRIQKRFKVKQIYIISIKEKIELIKNSINIRKDELVSNEEKLAFLQGAFLAVGNLTNPSTSGYHLEFIFNNSILSNLILDIVNDFKLKGKIIKRKEKCVVYIKSSESISDLIRMFKATNSLFYFEDIRIYKDHKNMLNRLNNCELANQVKVFNSAKIQVDNINYLKKHDLFDLLDDKTKLIASYRCKYNESSMQELSDIITKEEGYKIGKSGINHHFIKIKNLKEKHERRHKSAS